VTSPYGVSIAADLAACFALPHISDHEFALFQSLIRREGGIHLGPTKKPMLVSRLMRRLAALKLTSFSDYYHHVVTAGPDELVVLLDLISTNETWFFRNRRHFSFLEEQLCRTWSAEAAEGRRGRQIHAWSAGCSSGEEPFSVAMVLLDAIPGWSISIRATDLSARVLERARAATWPLDKSQDIPAQYLKRYMLRGTRSQEGNMKAGLELQNVVSFSRLNLNDESWPAEAAGPFDVIFCRNVLMYFETACRARAVRSLVARLAPRGYIFVGDAEGLGGFDELRMAIPGVYTRTGNPDLRGSPARS
jgi:chemotaxis protein methyltransferase CheR